MPLQRQYFQQFASQWGKEISKEWTVFRILLGKLDHGLIRRAA